MKYARDRKITSSHTAEVLIEAFPWIKNATGKTILIKYGGAAMVDPELRNAVMSDIVMLKIMGVNPVIVHGGGAAINKNMDKFGIDVEFKDGQRVTSDEAMDVVKMTLVGKVNEELVLAMNEHGNLAVGVNGTDAGTIIAKQRTPELGRVGTVTEVNPAYINALIASDYVPIIASVGKGDDGGSYNINADAAACAIASAIGAHKIIFLTDVDGIYTDFSDKSTLVLRASLSEMVKLAESGTMSSGMIPKINACVTALSAGVSKAHIINGTTPHALVLEIFTDAGVGTMVMRHHDDSIDPGFVEAPVSNFASKLDQSIQSIGRR